VSGDLRGELLEAFAAQVAVSLENAKLFDDALNIKNYNESILTSTSNGTVTLDADGRIVTANAAAQALLDSGLDAIVGPPPPSCSPAPTSGSSTRSTGPGAPARRRSRSMPSWRARVARPRPSTSPPCR
jgi:hypothetical protein